MDQAALIISDDPEFSRAIMERWQKERLAPALTLMSGDLCRDLDRDSFDLAIVGAIRPDVLPRVLQSLESIRRTILFVHAETRPPQVPRPLDVRFVQRREGWLDALVLVASEVLRLGQATERAERAEETAKNLERQAALGRYMLDVRHTLNNALTSVLGNSELILLESGALPPGLRSQVETIRNMSLRMHEILQRFSSIEKELNALERQAENEARTRVRAAGM